MKKLNLFLSILLIGGGMMLTSCDQDDNPATTPSSKTGIPDDSEAAPTPVIAPSDINAVLANINSQVEYINGEAVIRLELPGIKNPNVSDPKAPDYWVELYGTNHSGQNVFVDIDDVPKGFIIEKVSSENKGAVDLVFLVDNSGTMSEEANTIAEQIIDWSNELSTNLDVRFGCVGYDGRITGALNMTSAEELSKYLNAYTYTGTGRTRHFGGPDASELEAKAAPYQTSTGQVECGVAALRYAHEVFSDKFRDGANRIYVNLTDEPNQPSGKADFSTEWVKDNWNNQGTIYTVYSGTGTDLNFTEILYQKECPWNLSEYTGVDKANWLFTDPSFTGVKLSDLPVTGAIMNTYIIKFNAVGLNDGQGHNVHIIVKDSDKNIFAEKTYLDITF